MNESHKCSTMRIKVNLAGVTQDATETKEGIIVPDSLAEQVRPWMPLLNKIAKLAGDRVLVSSVQDSFTGQNRSGTSHPNKWAIDVLFPDRTTGKVNPHLSDNLSMMLEISRRLRGPVMFAFESDHIHIELTNIMPGVFRYATLRPEYYANDRLQLGPPADSQRLWSVQPTKIELLQNDSLINAQRIATNTVLSNSDLVRMISQVTL